MWIRLLCVALLTGLPTAESLAMVDLSDRTIGGYLNSLYIPPSANPARIDPRLVDIAKEAAARFPMTVKVTDHGGFNPRKSGTPNHPGGWAMDFQIYDPSGRPLDNYQDPKTYRMYEQLAQTMRQVQQEKYPELDKTFRWGGYFGGRFGFDQMHVDITPGAGGNMRMGSWEYGLGRDSLGRPIAIPAYMRTAESVGLGDRWGTQLAALGYTGPDAVKRFQYDAGLKVDGILGPKTQTALASIATPTNNNAFAGLTNPYLSYIDDPVKGDHPDVLAALSGGTDKPLNDGVYRPDQYTPDFSEADPYSPGKTVARYPDFGETDPYGLPNVPMPVIPTPESPGRTMAMRGLHPNHWDRGTDVANLQTRLLAAGFNPGPLDGIYGPKTAAAVKAYQAANGLKTDAVAGPITQGSLISGLSKWASMTPPAPNPVTFAERFNGGAGSPGTTAGTMVGLPASWPSHSGFSPESSHTASVVSRAPPPPSPTTYRSTTTHRTSESQGSHH